MLHVLCKIDAEDSLTCSLAVPAGRCSAVWFVLPFHVKAVFPFSSAGRFDKSTCLTTGKRHRFTSVRWIRQDTATLRDISNTFTPNYEAWGVSLRAATMGEMIYCGCHAFPSSDVFVGRTDTCWTWTHLLASALGEGRSTPCGSRGRRSHRTTCCPVQKTHTRSCWWLSETVFQIKDTLICKWSLHRCIYMFPINSILTEFTYSI